MAKRTIQECDLSKEEYDPEDTVKITIKKAGKKEGRTYELSAASAAKLEQQLVAGQPLGPEWGFASTKQARPVPEKTEDRRKTLADLDAEPDDDQFVARKKAELKDAGVDLNREEEEPEQVEAGVSDIFVDNESDCRHMNKGRIQTTLKNKKRHIYRACRDCGKQIPEMTAEGRKAYLSGKVPDDIRIREFEK